MVYADLVVEDVLQEAAVRKVVAEHSTRVQLQRIHGKKGSGFIDRNIVRYANAAVFSRFIVIRDLDRGECAPFLARELLPRGVPAELVFCIAVRQVEAWFLADVESLTRFLRVSSLRVTDPESIDDPKRFLVERARRSRSRRIRESLVPAGVARVGPLYNSTMLEYVNEHWEISRAMKRSGSLLRLVHKVVALA